jgi:hypothetical protein
MDQNVTHAADGLPVKSFTASSSVCRNPLRSLSNNFDVPNYGILHFLGSHESFSAWSDEAYDAMTTLHHVAEVKPVILHSGVASRSILSRTYQWSAFSVPIWTLILSNS